MNDEQIKIIAKLTRDDAIDLYVESGKRVSIINSKKIASRRYGESAEYASIRSRCSTNGPSCLS